MRDKAVGSCSRQGCYIDKIRDGDDFPLLVGLRVVVGGGVGRSDGNLRFAAESGRGSATAAISNLRAIQFMILGC